MTRPGSRPLEVLDRIADRATRDPDAVAVRYLGPCTDARATLSYAELAAVSRSVATQLRARLSPGGVILVSGPNQGELVIAVVAALEAGMTVFPVAPGLTRHELRAAALRAGAAGVIAQPAALEALADAGLASWELHAVTRGAMPWSEVSDAAFSIRPPTLLLQSSGTTGGPKIVRRDGPSLDAVARNVHRALGLRDDDRVLAMISMCHSYGIENALLGPLRAGAEIVALEGFDPSLVAAALADADVTVFPGVPFVFQMLAEDVGAPLRHTLRLAYSAGGPLPVAVADGFARRAGVRVGQLYGATEVGSVTFRPPGDASREETFDAACVGHPMTGVELRVLDVGAPDVDRPLPAGVEGHVAVRAPSMLAGYVDDDTPAVEGGFFLTGDLGVLDERGRLAITGRIKLQIDVGGAKVNPLEVENVLKEMPGVAECVVVPMAVTATLNRLRAVVVPASAAAPPTIDEMRRFARERLAGHKVPRVFEVRASVPRSPTGKILRRRIEGEAT